MPFCDLAYNSPEYKALIESVSCYHIEKHFFKIAVVTYIEKIGPDRFWVFLETSIGRVIKELLPKKLQQILKILEEETSSYNSMFLNIAVAYGGQQELVDAIKKIASLVSAGKLNVNDIDKKIIESCLYTSHLPQSDPDLILRTSGEKRLSGFLLWQSAYSELVFMDVFWPEFRKIDFMRAIRTYQNRIRRFGK